MKKFLFLAICTSLVGFSVSAIETPVLAEKNEGEANEQRINFQDLPAPIKKALKDLKVGQVSEIEREKNEDGSVIYEVELQVGEHEVELEFAADGRLLELEIEEGDDDEDDDDA